MGQMEDILIESLEAFCLNFSESKPCRPVTLTHKLQMRYSGFENVTSTLTIINAKREKLIKEYNLIANLSLDNVTFERLQSRVFVFSHSIMNTNAAE